MAYRFVVLITLIVAGQAAAESVTVVLKDGRILEGRVSDLGRSSLELRRARGSRLIPKVEVAHWSLSTEESDSKPKLILVLITGLVFSGEVEYLGARRAWTVELDFGGSAEYPESEVLRVVQPTGVATDGSFTPRPGFADRLLEAIESVRTGDKKALEEGLGIIERAGFFAIRLLEEAVAQSDPGGRLSRVLRAEKLRVAIPEEILLKNPNLIHELLTAPVNQRITALRESFFDGGEDVYPLFVRVVLDPTFPDELRGFAVDLLQRTNQVRHLLEAYEEATGQTQFAIAVALGDAGIYAGLETLIEALEIKEVKDGERDLRGVAIEKLEEYTGTTRGYSLNATPEQRQEAIVRWRSWWATEEGKVRTALKFQLNPDEVSPQRLRASQYWRQAINYWENNEFDLAENLLDRAIAEDPTSLPPFIGKGILAYQRRADFEGAKEWFRRALRRAPSKGEELSLRFAYYHLGRLSEIEYDFEAAETYLRRAVDLDPTFSQAWFDLGMSSYKAALFLPATDPEARRNQFEKSVGFLEEGFQATKSTREKMVLLSRSDIPLGADLPFSTRTYNRGMRDLKQRLARYEARFCHQLAIVSMALGNLSKAVEWSQLATSYPDPVADHLRLHLSILKRLGREGEAKAAAQKLEQVLRRQKQAGQS